jgi:hypothetical protein
VLRLRWEQHLPPVLPPPHCIVLLLLLQQQHKAVPGCAIVQNAAASARRSSSVLLLASPWRLSRLVPSPSAHLLASWLAKARQQAQSPYLSCQSRQNSMQALCPCSIRSSSRQELPIPCGAAASMTGWQSQGTPLASLHSSHQQVVLISQVMQ